jgi:hypothetical protein
VIVTSGDVLPDKLPAVDNGEKVVDLVIEGMQPGTAVRLAESSIDALAGSEELEEKVLFFVGCQWIEEGDRIQRFPEKSVGVHVDLVSFPPAQTCMVCGEVWSLCPPELSSRI